MATAVVHIAQNIATSYTSSLNEEEKINTFLDQINNHKEDLYSITTELVHLTNLFSQITWIDNLSTSDKVLIKGVIAMGKEADVVFKKFYASQRRAYRPKGLFKEELEALKEAIDTLIENVLEIEHIIFGLREDKDFNELSAQLDTL